MGDTATQLGNAMDELMRHQPSLKTAATGAIIKLLEEVCSLGRDPKYVCWKSSNSSSKPENGGPVSGNEIPVEAANGGAPNEAGGSSDEEDDDEEEGGGKYIISRILICIYFEF